MKVHIIISVLSLVVDETVCALNYRTVLNDWNITNEWIQSIDDFEDIAYPQKEVLITALDKLINSSDTQSLQPNCIESVRFYRDSLISRKRWTFQMIDASAKGSGMFSIGHFVNLGKRHDCLDVSVDEAPETIDDKFQSPYRFKGKYCQLRVSFPTPAPSTGHLLRQLNLNVSNTELEGTLYQYYADHIEFFQRDSFSFGICIPSTCGRRDLEIMTRSLLGANRLHVTVRPYCQSADAEPRQPDKLALTSSMLIYVYCFFVIFCSIFCESLLRCNIPQPSFFLHFSIRRHTERLTADLPKDRQKMAPAETFKGFFQMAAVVFHVVVVGFGAAPIYFPVFVDIRKSLGISELFNGIVARYIFGTQFMLTLSGFGSGIAILTLLKKRKGNIPFHLYVLKRLLRMWPVLIFTMLWSFTWLNDMSAPGGREVADFLTKPCRENWWKTLFMVNNINTAGKDICLPQSWFITLDMQLWVVAYIPLHLLHKKPRVGIWACLFLIIAGGMSSMVLSYLTDTPSAPVERQFDFMNAMLHDPIFISVFTFVHSGLSSYFIGVLVAHCCLTYKMSEFKVKVLSCLCPALAVGILVFPEAWSHLYGLQYDRVLDIFYSGFFRLFFAIILIPQLLHMHYGFGENDRIRKFLSGKFWLIAGRLSYSVFVTHMLVIVIVSFVIYDKVPTDALKLTVFLIICEVTCFVFAYLVYVFVESPFASLLSAFTTPNATRVSKEIKPDMILV